MILHNISIHLFMPAGIDTPGFVEEEKEKPAVTRKIEESDEQISAEKCAEYLIAGESPSSSLSSSSSPPPSPIPLAYLLLPLPALEFYSPLFLPSLKRRRSGLLIIGVEKGYYQFTSHLIAELIRVVSKGSAPGNNLLMDVLYSIVALVSLLEFPRPCPSRKLSLNSPFHNFYPHSPNSYFTSLLHPSAPTLVVPTF
jgi:hypothetical protein